MKPFFVMSIYFTPTTMILIKLVRRKDENPYQHTALIYSPKITLILPKNEIQNYSLNTYPVCSKFYS